MQANNEKNTPNIADVNEKLTPLFSSSITIYVNDKPTQTKSGQTLTAFLKEIQMEQGKNIAIAVNDSVVSKGQWSSYELQTDDRLLLIAPVSGG